MKLCFLQCIYCFRFSDSLPDVDRAEKLVSAARNGAASVLSVRVICGVPGVFCVLRGDLERREEPPHRS